MALERASAPRVRVSRRGSVLIDGSAARPGREAEVASSSDDDEAWREAHRRAVAAALASEAVEVGGGGTPRRGGGGDARAARVHVTRRGSIDIEFNGEGARASAQLPSPPKVAQQRRGTYFGATTVRARDRPARSAQPLPLSIDGLGSRTTASPPPPPAARFRQRRRSSPPMSRPCAQWRATLPNSRRKSAPSVRRTSTVSGAKRRLARACASARLLPRRARCVSRSANSLPRPPAWPWRGARQRGALCRLPPPADPPPLPPTAIARARASVSTPPAAGTARGGAAEPTASAARGAAASRQPSAARRRQRRRLRMGRQRAEQRLAAGPLAE